MIKSQHKIVCDGCGKQEAEAESDYANRTVSRLRAYKLGWLYLNPGIDLCPDCRGVSQ